MFKINKDADILVERGKIKCKEKNIFLLKIVKCLHYFLSQFSAFVN